jgi:WD40 repeat protein
LAYYTSQGHSAKVGSVAVSGDVDILVSGCDDGTLRVWEFDDEATAYRLTKFFDQGENESVVHQELSMDA